MMFYIYFYNESLGHDGDIACDDETLFNLNNCLWITNEYKYDKIQNSNACAVSNTRFPFNYYVALPTSYFSFKFNS